MANKKKTIKARVIFKGMDMINGNACHFITFEELSTGERVYLQVGIGNYMMIVEGDRGELYYKERRKRYKSKFKSFDRVVYNLREEALPMEETYDEAGAISLREKVLSMEETHGENDAVSLREEASPMEEAYEDDGAISDTDLIAILEAAKHSDYNENGIEEIVVSEEDVTTLEIEEDFTSEEDKENEAAVLNEPKATPAPKKNRKKK